MSMLEELEGKPAPDPAEPVHRLRRQIRWLQAIVLLGFAGIAGALYWQSQVIATSLADAQRPFVAFKDGQFLPVTGTGQPAWQFLERVGKRRQHRGRRPSGATERVDRRGVAARSSPGKTLRPTRLAS